MAFTRRMQQASAGRMGSITEQLAVPSFTSITVNDDVVTFAFSSVPGATLYRVETELVV